MAQLELRHLKQRGVRGLHCISERIFDTQPPHHSYKNDAP